MAGQNISLRVQNLTPFDSEVKLLYTGTDDPNFSIPYYNAAGNPTSPTGSNFSPVNGELIGWDTTPKIRRDVVTYPAQWATAFPTPFTFQNADGSVWVTDGETIPFAFNTAFTFKSNFIYGITLVSHTVNVTIGMPIDEMLRLSAEGIRDALIVAVPLTSAIAQLLGNATPIGITLNYEKHPTFLTNTLAIRLTTTNNVLGTPGAFQTVQIGGQAPLNLANSNVANGFNIQEDGWTKYLVVTDRTGGSYLELLNSLSNQSLITEDVVRYSNNTEQINEPISWKAYDISGTKSTYTDTGVVDPYQGQSSNSSSSEILVDGQVYAQFNSLAGEFMDITISYDSSGVITIEQIETLEKILHEQGMDDMRLSEEKELNKIYSKGTKNITESYLNFSGTKIKEHKSKFLLGIIILILIFRTNVGEK